MGFLQPWILFALPLAIIPIAIHLANQWRYQTKPWAAMMFLLRAKTMHRGFDRLRQWIILSLRVAAVIGVVLAVSRPISSGVVAWIAGGDLDTIIVLMDCSPTMSATGPDADLSKHQTAIKQLRNSLSMFNASKWVMVDSNSLKATQFASSQSLLSSPAIQTSDTPCDWPAMLESALSYLDIEKPAQAHVWIVSDLQASNFSPSSPRWESIRDRLIAQRATVKITSIEYPDPPRSNYAIHVTDARWERRSNQRPTDSRVGMDLYLSIVIESTLHIDSASTIDSRSIPVSIAWQGNEIQASVDVSSGRGELKDYRVGSLDEAKRSLDSDSAQESGTVSLQTWGSVRLPLDGNLADNEDFFAADLQPIARTIVVCDRSANVLPVILAAESPADPSIQSEVVVVPPSSFDPQSLDGIAFLVWQSASPDPTTAKAIYEFVNRGGSLWMFPPEQINGPSVSSAPQIPEATRIKLDDEPNKLLEISWDEWNNLPEPISPTTWRSDVGLLRATQSGASLEVGELRVKKLATILGKLTAVASFADGRVLIAALGVSSTEFIVWATLPVLPFSAMASSADNQAGVVLYVTVQRAIESGIRNLSSIVNTWATAENSSSENLRFARLPRSQKWEPIITTEGFLSNQMTNHAGVFRAGAKIVAIHRPRLEDNAKMLEIGDWNRLFEGVAIKRLSEQTGSSNDLQSEAWRGFMVLLICAMLGEAAMSLPKMKQT